MGPRTLSKPAEQELGLKQFGIVVATIAEARSLTKRPVGAGGSISLRKGWVVQVSGVGPGRARVAAERLLEAGATTLISWGSAAGLVPELLPGSLVLPKTIIGDNHVVYSADATWQDSLLRRLRGHLEVHQGPLAESLTVLRDYEEKAALSRRTGAVAADMESAAVAAVAHKAGIPFLSIRAVADPVDMAVPLCAPIAVDEFGRLRPCRLLKELIKHPIQLLPLARLGRCFHAARATLSMVAPLLERWP